MLFNPVILQAQIDNIVQPQWGSTMLSNIVDKSEQCWHNQKINPKLLFLVFASSTAFEIYSRGSDIYEYERFVARGQGDRNGKYPELFFEARMYVLKLLYRHFSWMAARTTFYFDAKNFTWHRELSCEDKEM